MIDKDDRPLVIGVTGGIASGKSAAAQHFARLGVEVIDTDQIAHELTAPGQDALAEIARAFGAQMLDENGALRRRTLRNLILGDPSARRRLESLLHPRIIAELQRRIEEVDDAYCLAVVPLLVESGLADRFDRVLVIDVPESVQLSRVVARDGMSHDAARAALAAQASRDQRLAIADDVIANTGSLHDLEREVERLHAAYRRMATQRHPRRGTEDNDHE